MQPLHLRCCRPCNSFLKYIDGQASFLIFLHSKFQWEFSMIILSRYWFYLHNSWTFNHSWWMPSIHTHFKHACFRASFRYTLRFNFCVSVNDHSFNSFWRKTFLSLFLTMKKRTYFDFDLKKSLSTSNQSHGFQDEFMTKIFMSSCVSLEGPQYRFNLSLMKDLTTLSLYLRIR